MKKQISKLKTNWLSFHIGTVAAQFHLSYAKALLLVIYLYTHRWLSTVANYKICIARVFCIAMLKLYGNRGWYIMLMPDPSCLSINTPKSSNKLWAMIKLKQQSKSHAHLFITQNHRLCLLITSHDSRCTVCSCIITYNRVPIRVLILTCGVHGESRIVSRV